MLEIVVTREQACPKCGTPTIPTWHHTYHCHNCWQGWNLKQGDLCSQLAGAYGFSTRRIRDAVKKGKIPGVYMDKDGEICFEGAITSHNVVETTSGFSIITGPVPGEPHTYALPIINGKPTSRISPPRTPDGLVSEEILIVDFRVKKPPQHSELTVMTKTTCTSGDVMTTGCYPT